MSSKSSRTALVSPGAIGYLIDLNITPPTGKSSSFDIISTESAAVVTLLLPNGTEVNSGNAQSLGYTHSTWDASSTNELQSTDPFFSRGTHTVLTVPIGAPSGVYKVKVNTMGVSVNTVIVASYYSASLVQAGVITNATTYRVNDTVIISGLIFNAASPVNGANMIAIIGDSDHPDSDAIEVALQDSGPQDAAPGDGIYTGIYTASQAGNFTVALKASGTLSSGEAYSRITSTTIKVIAPLASFTTFNNSFADEDGSGRPDKIVVTANLNVQTGGKYFFTVDLVANSGLKLTGRARAALQAGSNKQMQAKFDINDLRGLGGNGTYSLKEATLIYEDDKRLPLADYRENAGSTQNYSLGTFDRAPVLFTGPNSITEVDNNHNGKIDGLVVNATVDVLNAGSYYWAAALLDSTGQEIDYYSTKVSTSLLAGQRAIQFAFDGQQISRSQKNGPYTVGRIEIWGSAEVNLDSLMTTAAYAYTQFDKPIVINCSNTTVSAPSGQSQVVVRYNLPRVTGNTNPTTVTCAPASGSYFNVGTTTVNCTAVEADTNYTDVCSFTLTVTAGGDTTPPTIVCPTTAYAVIQYGQSSGPVIYPAPTVTDNSGVASFACTPASGSTLSRGVTTVTCTAADTAGNQSSCSFTLRVFDVSLQDNQLNHTLWFDSVTGDYFFFSCDASGYTLAGRGTITRQGCNIILGGDPRVSATFEACPSTPSIRRGSAVIKPNPVGGWFYITDSNSLDNLPSCPIG